MANARRPSISRLTSQPERYLDVLGECATPNSNHLPDGTYDKTGKNFLAGIHLARFGGIGFVGTRKCRTADRRGKLLARENILDSALDVSDRAR
jgi:hypothetical protein